MAGAMTTRHPCDVCCRVHRGPRCKPEESRSVNVVITMPAHVARELRERVWRGERSRFVTDLVESALERGDGS